MWSHECESPHSRNTPCAARKHDGVGSPAWRHVTAGSMRQDQSLGGTPASTPGGRTWTS
jgi:hypothetical protein